ncbi:MAG TPA: glycosyltransferase family 2 protein [Armatimonadota bacterium]|nr:glycosyltransferase family 2 protein [Armatimonadota bacterium]
MDLSVVLVNWNTRELLRACLRSLQEALAGSALAAEIVVVDNASADGSAEMVERQFPGIRLLANEVNRNYAEGNNQGIAAAAGEFLLLLNPDTEVPVGAAEALLADLRENPRAAAVSPALVHPDGTVQESVRGFPAPRALVGELTGLARLLPRSRWAAYRARALPEDRISSVEQPMASAFLVRRSALEQVGAFDPQFPLFFNDVDLCYRLKEAGWEILYDPRVRVVHVGGASTRQVRPEAIRQSHEGLRRFYAKHYRRRLPAPLYGLILAAIRAAERVRLAGARGRG